MVNQVPSVPPGAPHRSWTLNEAFGQVNGIVNLQKEPSLYFTLSCKYLNPQTNSFDRHLFA